MRLGTPAITTRGLGVTEMKTLAGWMKRVAEICQKAQTEEKLTEVKKELNAVKSEVKALALKFPIW